MGIFQKMHRFFNQKRGQALLIYLDQKMHSSLVLMLLNRPWASSLFYIIAKRQKKNNSYKNFQVKLKTPIFTSYLHIGMKVLGYSHNHTPHAHLESAPSLCPPDPSLSGNSSLPSSLSCLESLLVDTSLD